MSQYNPLTEAAIERARTFKGKRNSNWTPYMHEFDGVEMCLVPVGKFMMGADDITDDEKPVHEQNITISYWIDRYPVTNMQYKRAVDAGGCEPPKDGRFYDDAYFANHPMVYVDWHMVVKYAEWRSTLAPEITYRLPTEREWEYVARGVESWAYPWGNDFVADNVVYWENSGGQTADVTSRPNGSSWVDARHLSGNAWEWCSSIYQSYPYQADDGREELNRTNARRMLRGGSWFDVHLNMRAAFRVSNNPLNCRDNIGFRVVHIPSLS